MVGTQDLLSNVDRACSSGWRGPTQNANGVLKTVYLAVLLAFVLHRCTQLAPYWVYVLDRNLFGAFSIQINRQFALFLIDFSSVWY